jgi:F420-dependent oxidoreductase-like protein
MHFSVWPTTRQPWDDLFDLARHVGATGWDGIWVADHFMPAVPPLEVPVQECWTTLGGLATAVPRVRLGSLVVGNTYRHPAVVANMAATVDHMSGGRMVLGLGAGWQVNEHDVYGIPLPSTGERLARLEEACAVIKGLLGQTRTSVAGRYYTITDAPLEPKPVQATLPLLIGGAGEQKTLRIAARWADEWNTWGDPDFLARKAAVLDQRCEEVGRDPKSIQRSAQAIVEPEAPGIRTRPYSTGQPRIGGSVEQLRDVVGRYREAGIDEFIVPDWNTGRGDARSDFFDWFLSEVASLYRS